MNWYKIRVDGGVSGERGGRQYVGCSADPWEEMVAKAQRGEYLRLDDLLFQDRGEIRDWSEWDNREDLLHRFG